MSVLLSSALSWRVSQAWNPHQQSDFTQALTVVMDCYWQNCGKALIIPITKVLTAADRAAAKPLLRRLLSSRQLPGECPPAGKEWGEPPFTVHCKIAFARPDERETCPYHCSMRLITMFRRSSRGPIACWILARTSWSVTWSVYELSLIHI